MYKIMMCTQSYFNFHSSGCNTDRPCLPGELDTCFMKKNGTYWSGVVFR